MKPIGLFTRGGRVPKSFFFEKPNGTMSFLRSALQSTLLKHAGEFFFVLVETFLSSKMPRNSLRKSFAHKSCIQRANNASRLISHFDVAYCYGLYGLSAFSNRPTVLRKF